MVITGNAGTLTQPLQCIILSVGRCRRPDHAPPARRSPGSGHRPGHRPGQHAGMTAGNGHRSGQLSRVRGPCPGAVSGGRVLGSCPGAVSAGRVRGPCPRAVSGGRVLGSCPGAVSGGRVRGPCPGAVSWERVRGPCPGTVSAGRVRGPSGQIRWSIFSCSSDRSVPPPSPSASIAGRGTGVTAASFLSSHDFCWESVVRNRRQAGQL